MSLEDTWLLMKASPKTIDTILTVLLTGTGLLTLVGSYGDLDWRFDLASHFRVQYFGQGKILWFS